MAGGRRALPDSSSQSRREEDDFHDAASALKNNQEKVYCEEESEDDRSGRYLCIVPGTPSPKKSNQRGKQKQQKQPQPQPQQQQQQSSPSSSSSPSWVRNARHKLNCVVPIHKLSRSDLIAERIAWEALNHSNCTTEDNDDERTASPSSKTLEKFPVPPEAWEDSAYLTRSITSASSLFSSSSSSSPMRRSTRTSVNQQQEQHYYYTSTTNLIVKKSTSEEEEEESYDEIVTNRHHHWVSRKPSVDTTVSMTVTGGSPVSAILASKIDEEEDDYEETETLVGPPLKVMGHRGGNKSPAAAAEVDGRLTTTRTIRPIPAPPPPPGGVWRARKPSGRIGAPVAPPQQRQGPGAIHHLHHHHNISYMGGGLLSLGGRHTGTVEGQQTIKGRNTISSSRRPTSTSYHYGIGGDTSAFAAGSAFWIWREDDSDDERVGLLRGVQGTTTVARWEPDGLLRGEKSARVLGPQQELGHEGTTRGYHQNQYCQQELNKVRNATSHATEPGMEISGTCGRGSPPPAGQVEKVWDEVSSITVTPPRIKIAKGLRESNESKPVCHRQDNGHPCVRGEDDEDQSRTSHSPVTDSPVSSSVMQPSLPPRDAHASSAVLFSEQSISNDLNCILQDYHDYDASVDSETSEADPLRMLHGLSKKIRSLSSRLEKQLESSGDDGSASVTLNSPGRNFSSIPLPNSSSNSDIISVYTSSSSEPSSSYYENQEKATNTRSFFWRRLSPDPLCLTDNHHPSDTRPLDDRRTEDEEEIAAYRYRSLVDEGDCRPPIPLRRPSEPLPAPSLEGSALLVNDISGTTRAGAHNQERALYFI